ncbi:MAG: type II toxin-antitoxin system PemK/MazF family toxin [Actinomycetia bacterium]|nr:type II toxin-antitoxin system PemK/MazF family toxin [Actinomycetes bacterium]
MTKYNYGEAWFVDMNPTIGAEQGEMRTVIIVSNDDFNSAHAKMRWIVPISTSPKYGRDTQWRDSPWIVPVPDNDFGTVGYILIDHIRAIDISNRAKRKWGTFSKEDIEPISEIIAESVLPD